MEKEKFQKHLEEASKHLIEFTQTLCYNDFSDSFQYIITPNMRYVDRADSHLNEKEISVLKIWNKYEGQLLTAKQVVDLFHHDNKVPVWIDISVYESSPELTVIDLFCSRRLREEKDLMHQGLHPFHLQVAIPPDPLKVEKEGKFDVNWKKHLHLKQKQKGFLQRLKQLFN